MEYKRVGSFQDLLDGTLVFTPMMYCGSDGALISSIEATGFCGARPDRGTNVERVVGRSSPIFIIAPTLQDIAAAIKEWKLDLRYYEGQFYATIYRLVDVDDLTKGTEGEEFHSKDFMWVIERALQWARDNPSDPQKSC